jgi:DNA-binding NtrC family response regulator
MVSSGKPLILVADDDINVLNAMQFRLEELGYRVHCAPDKQRMWERLAVEEPVLLLLDLRFGKDDGAQVLCEVLKRRPHLCVVMFTGHATVETAVSAIKLGAFDYLTKPLDLNRFGVIVGRAIEKHVSNKRLERLEQLMVERGVVQPFIGTSPAMNRVDELITSISATDATVLILGETGTGKELVARMLHYQSNRRQGPFVPVNMASLPRELAESTLFGHEKGAFTGADKAQAGCCEAADKGTLFLDEIGDMEMQLQAKLLRFLQERSVQRVGSNKAKKVDVRIVAATNCDLQALIREGGFREDLYYRLHVIPIVVPPLRERPQDIPLLAVHFLQRAAVRYRKNLVTFTDEALQAMVAYDWPGNVRQLENVVERVAILGKRPEIEREDLPSEVLQQVPWPVAAVGLKTAFPHSGRSVSSALRDESLTRIEQMEKKAILEVLEKTRGSVLQTAQLLGLGQATVYRKIKRYGISLAGLKRPAAEES